MLTTYWELKYNPFAKSAPADSFPSEDFMQATARLERLVEMKGIGLFTGLPGSGKTFTIKHFVDSLNTALFKPIYLPLSTLTVRDFYCALALGLGITPQFKKIDLFLSIQERILNLAKDKRITTVLILDEAQYLNTKILNDLKILMNFDMDSKNYASVIISGQPILNNTLSMQAHEALAQRIIINYTFTGLSKQDLHEYISTRLKCAGVSVNMFSENAIEAIWSCSGTSPRVVNNLAEKALLIGAMQKKNLIDADIIMLAQSEVSLI